MPLCMVGIFYGIFTGGKLGLPEFCMYESHAKDILSIYQSTLCTQEVITNGSCLY